MHNNKNMHNITQYNNTKTKTKLLKSQDKAINIKKDQAAVNTRKDEAKKIKENHSQKDTKKSKARKNNHSHVVSKTISQASSQGVSVKKQWVANMSQEQNPLESSVHLPVAQIEGFQSNDNQRLDSIQSKVDRLENELTILQTAVAGVIKRLGDMEQTVKDVSNLTQTAVRVAAQQNQPPSNLAGASSKNIKDHFAENNESTIKIIMSPSETKEIPYDITRLKVGIAGIPQPGLNETPLNTAALKPEPTLPESTATITTSELYTDINGSSGIVLPIISSPTSKEISSDIITGPEPGNDTLQSPGTNSTRFSEMQPFPETGGLVNITEMLHGDESLPTIATLEPLPGTNGMLISKTQDVHGKVPGKGGMATNKTKNMHGTDVPTIATLQPLPGANGMLVSKTQRLHGKVPGKGGMAANKTKNLLGTDVPTIATLQPLPGANGMLINKTKSLHGKYKGKGKAKMVASKTQRLHGTELPIPIHATVKPLPMTGRVLTNKLKSGQATAVPVHNKVEPLPGVGEPDIGITDQSSFDESGPSQEPDQSTDDVTELFPTDQSYDVNSAPFPGKGPDLSSDVITGPTPDTDQSTADNATPTPGTDQSQTTTMATSPETDQSQTNIVGTTPGTDQSEGDDPFMTTQTGRPISPFQLAGQYPLSLPMTSPFSMRYRPGVELKSTHQTQSPHRILIPLGAINGLQTDVEPQSDNSEYVDERNNVHTDIQGKDNTRVVERLSGNSLKIDKPTEQGRLDQRYKPLLEKERLTEHAPGQKMTNISQINGATTSSHDALGQQKVVMDIPQEDQKANTARPIINIIVPNSETATLLRKEMCQPPCKNGGKCVSINTCRCPTLFLGNQCERFSLLELLNKHGNESPTKHQYEQTTDNNRSLQRRRVTIEDLLRSLARRYRSRSHRQQVSYPFARNTINYRLRNVRDPLSYSLQKVRDSNAYRYQNIQIPNGYRFQNDGDYYDREERRKSIVPRRILTRNNPQNKRKQYVLEI